MPIASLTCAAPVRRRIERVRPDYELLEAAIESFAEGDHKAAIARTFEHLFGKSAPDLAVEAFSFVQGSSRVSLSIEGDDLCASVPLVRLGEGGKTTAALRYLLTRISGSGQLHQPRLRGNDVFLEYRGPVTRVHPLKLIEILRRMPVEADESDDWLVDQFGSLPLGREPIEPLTDEELTRAEAIWQQHWAEVEELLKESQRKRSMSFLDEVTSFANYHLHAALPIAGSLLARLNEGASVFNNEDTDPLKRESSLGSCIKEMRAVSREALASNLGHAHYSISPLIEGTPTMINHYLGDGDYAQSVERTRAAGKSMEAAVSHFATYNLMLARVAWPADTEAGLLGALEQASGKPWREAATILIARGKELADGFAPEEDTDDEEGDPDAIADDASADEQGGAA